MHVKCILTIYHERRSRVALADSSPADETWIRRNIDVLSRCILVVLLTLPLPLRKANQYAWIFDLDVGQSTGPRVSCSKLVVPVCGIVRVWRVLRSIAGAAMFLLLCTGHPHLWSVSHSINYFRTVGFSFFSFGRLVFVFLTFCIQKGPFILGLDFKGVLFWIFYYSFRLFVLAVDIV